MTTAIQSKRCQRCEQVKSVVDFTRALSHSPDGFKPYCRPCVNAMSRMRNNPVSVSEKRCPHCKQTKAAGAFWISKATADGLAVWCRDCAREQKRQVAGTKPVTEKKCSRCHTIKTAEFFNSNTGAPDGLSSSCSECTVWNKVFRLYGITRQEYEKRFQAQGGLCKICGKPSVERLSVDHDHATGAIRDLLCGGCNRAIGFALDSPRILRLAADYLERHGKI
jgi:hypothetical protein